ncbi:MAG: preprotein translocase subunit YajC [Lachnospiraceae bacterium]|nr:preprotein translocase subunit YajC [Lachnospiraceae bacterium]
MSILLSAAAGGQQGGMLQGGVVMLVYLVIVVGFFLVMTQPQKKEKKRIEAMLADLSIGDSVLTTSGFYGMVIDINEEQNIVIVEFGSDRHCRIPMNKSAIAQVEKPDAE